MGAEYEVTFSGREQDLIKYAKEHLGFDDKPGSFQQLKIHLNMMVRLYCHRNVTFI